MDNWAGGIGLNLAPIFPLAAAPAQGPPPPPAAASVDRVPARQATCPPPRCSNPSNPSPLCSRSPPPSPHHGRRRQRPAGSQDRRAAAPFLPRPRRRCLGCARAAPACRSSPPCRRAAADHVAPPPPVHPYAKPPSASCLSRPRPARPCCRRPEYLSRRRRSQQWPERHRRRALATSGLWASFPFSSVSMQSPRCPPRSPSRSCVSCAIGRTPMVLPQLPTSCPAGFTLMALVIASYWVLAVRIFFEVKLDYYASSSEYQVQRIHQWALTLLAMLEVTQLAMIMGMWLFWGCDLGCRYGQSFGLSTVIM